MRKYILTILLLFGHTVQAQTSAIEIRHSNGDVLSIQRLANGEVWASMFLSDRMIASFASHELIVLQVDKHQPVKLEQGFRSCGAPAPKKQQVVYQVEQTDEAWALSGTQRPETDVLKLLGWDQNLYLSLHADRRPEVVDFPIDAGGTLSRQLKAAESVRFRYVTDQGVQRESVFQLAPHRQILEKLIP
jgi:hypothetical protein